MALNQALDLNQAQHDADLAATLNQPEHHYPKYPAITDTKVIDPDEVSRQLMKSMLSMIVMWK
jgi:hypothetical protein